MEIFRNLRFPGVGELLPRYKCKSASGGYCRRHNSGSCDKQTDSEVQSEGGEGREEEEQEVTDLRLVLLFSVEKSSSSGEYISTMMEQAEEKGVDVDELAHEILVLIQKKL